MPWNNLEWGILTDQLFPEIPRPFFPVITGILQQTAFHYMRVSMLGRVLSFLNTLISSANLYIPIPLPPKKDLRDPQVGLVLTLGFSCLSLEIWLDSDWIARLNTLQSFASVFVRVANLFDWGENGRKKEDCREDVVVV